MSKKILFITFTCSNAVNPIYGVNLPEHFILCYKDEAVPIKNKEDDSNILFYINPFSKGDIFNKKEIDNFLVQLKISKEKVYYTPCSNTEMIQRLIRNLMNSYHKLGFMDKVEELNLLMRAVN